MFQGGSIPSELQGAYQKWMILVHVFLRCIDRENGSYAQMPYSGGVMEQPERTMQAMDLLQGVYGEELNRRIKQSGKKHR